MSKINYNPMESSFDTFTLNSGINIPCIGFGTWQTPDGETAVNSVKCAVETGYRHIDTAAIYGNEKSVRVFGNHIVVMTLGIESRYSHILIEN
jgi:diketogulonate reductase-like aldo/keto reductase